VHAGTDTRDAEAAPPGRGALIVIEGIDGAGKSTQHARLAERLAAEGYAVTASREPTDGPHGRRIREIAREGRRAASAEEEVRLFLDDRREHVSRVIAPALAAGRVVLLDRYYLSTIAYQGALGIDPGFIQQANESFAPPPDLALILMLPVAQALDRIRAGRPGGLDLAFERADYLERVAALFRSMPDRLDPSVTEVRIVDASGDADLIARRLAELSLARLADLGVPRRWPGHG
ncbi:MAG TPA: dTMP kinase, partial [Thermodesulfobacteriota bacterium]